MMAAQAQARPRGRRYNNTIHHHRSCCYCYCSRVLEPFFSHIHAYIYMLECFRCTLIYIHPYVHTHIVSTSFVVIAMLVFNHYLYIVYSYFCFYPSRRYIPSTCIRYIIVVYRHTRTDLACFALHARIRTRLADHFR